MTYDFVSGMDPRPSTLWNSLSRSCSLTDSAVGLTEEGCCAIPGGHTTVRRQSAEATSIARIGRYLAICDLQIFCRPIRAGRMAQQRLLLPLGRDRLAISRLPAPSTRTVAALDHSLFENLGDDLTVSGKQRLGRAHLRAERQLSLGEAVTAVLLILGLAQV